MQHTPDNIPADRVRVFMRWWRGCGVVFRAFAIASLAAATIYGGGKGSLPGRGRPVSVLPSGQLGVTPAGGQTANGITSAPMGIGYAAVSNLYFAAIYMSATNAVLGIGWDALTNSPAVLDIYAKTNLIERFWSHLAEMGVDAADGEATAEVQLSWLGNPPMAFFNLGGRLDSDGDGLPDAFERLAIGSDPALADTDGDGFGDFTEYLAGLDPSAEPPEFAAQGDSLAALELVPAFSAEFPETLADSNVWQRTIHVEPLDGLRQYFLSGSPDGLTPPNLSDLALEWDDGIVRGTMPANTAAFQLPVGGYRDCDLTLTLRRDAASVSMDTPLYLLASVPRITIDAATSAVAGGVTYYAADFSATRHIGIEVDCSGTPGTNRTVQSVFDGLSEFFWQSGIEVGLPDGVPGESLDGETCALALTVSGLGIHPLPSPVGAVPVRAGARSFPAAPRRAGGSDPGSSAILAISPYIEWSSNHDASYGGDTLAFDLATGTYSNICEHPLNSGCIWSQWFRGASGEFECSCEASVNLGTDDVPPGITTAIEYGDAGATGRVLLGGAEIWSGSSSHWRYRRWSVEESGATLLSSPDSDECGDPCGSCAGGSCDDFENPSLGSLRFRIPLSAPLDGHVDGFLWLDRDSAFWPSPAHFNISARDDADIETVRKYGSVRMVRSNSPRGRQVNIEDISRGVRLTVTNLFEGAGGRLDHTWEITRTNGVMRLRKISRAGNLMQDESFVLGGPEGQTTRIDNISGRTEKVSRQGAFTEDPESEIVERRTVSDASGAVFEETETVLRRFGEGHSAVEREIARRRMTPLATNETFATYWPDGKPMCSWGDDRPCHYTAFDGLGRETNSVSYFGGRGGVFQTITSYAPLSGDDADPRDRDEPRRIDEYRTGAGGEPVLAARTWFVHTRGVGQGWPTHTVATIRAASRDAAIGDPANAVAVSTDIDADAPGIPRVLRGKPVFRQDEGGGVTRHAWSPCAFSLENGAPAIAAGSTHWLCIATEEFGEEARPVARVSVIDAGTGGEVYSAQRHVASGLDFGWEAHLLDCRDRRVATLRSDGASSTNAYSCCRLLWSQDFDGARTLRSATTGQDSLYYAMEEVSLAQLPHHADYVPYGDFYDSDYGSYRATQHFLDAFGRETNTIVRTCKHEGQAVASDWTCAGWRASSSVAYPFGTSDYRVATDQRGNVTTTIRTTTPEADITQTIASDKTTTATAWRNGDSTTREEWTDVVTTPPSSRWRETRRFAEYAADGTRAEYSVVSSSDGDCTTNSITFHDFLGRVVRAVTPLSDTAYAYDGATARALSSFDAISGVAVTNLFDDLGELVGQVVSGVETRADTGYELVSNILWRVTMHSTSGGTRSVVSETRERLTGLSNELRGETFSYHNGALALHSRSWFDTTNSILTKVSESATAGTTTTKSKFGIAFETTTEAGTTSSFFDPYGRVFYTEKDGRSVDWIGRNDFGDIAEYDTFYAKGDNVYAEFYDYDSFGNRTSSTNALGAVSVSAYDAANRLSETGGAVYPARYGYDAEGHRTALSTTRDGNAWDTTTWAFDAATGLCTNKTYADGSQVSYTFTPDGRPLRTTYASGRWRENAYNEKRELVSTTDSDGEVCAFAYDDFGRVVAESNSVSSISYLLDDRYGATNEVQTVDGVSTSFSREFDAYGRLTANNGMHYTYCADGQLDAISGDEATVEYFYTDERHDAGYILTLTNGVAFQRSLLRDAYRPQMVTNIASSVNGAAVETLAYSYDALSRPISRNADTFGYNERSEVISATIDDNSASYDYDDIGNSASYTPNNLNQYTEFAYDQDGNLLADGVYSFTYDAANRLAGVSSNGTIVASFAYDAKSRRVKKVTPETTHTFFYDDWNLVEERVAYENGATSTIRYYWGKDLSGKLQGAGGVGGLLYLTVDDSIYVPFYDNNGNITRYLDANGNMVAQYTYDAFGNTISQTGSLSNFFRHRFSTKYFDIETGLYYYGYRFYHPTLMRWMNRDPIEESGGVNLYAMCGNDSVITYDLLGMANAFESDKFLKITSKIAKYKKKWYQYALGSQYVDIDISNRRKLPRFVHCGEIHSISYEILPAQGRSAFNTPGVDSDPYQLWTGKQIRTNFGWRHAFRYFAEVEFEIDGSVTSETLWDLIPNMNGQWTWDTIASKTVMRPITSGSLTLGVTVKLHLLFSGTNDNVIPDDDIFTITKDVYIIED